MEKSSIIHILLANRFHHIDGNPSNKISKLSPLEKFNSRKRQFVVNITLVNSMNKRTINIIGQYNSLFL